MERERGREGDEKEQQEQWGKRKEGRKKEKGRVREETLLIK